MEKRQRNLDSGIGDWILAKLFSDPGSYKFGKLAP